MPLPKVSMETHNSVLHDKQSEPDWAVRVLESLDRDNPVLASITRELMSELKCGDADEETLLAAISAALVFYEALRTEQDKIDLEQIFNGDPSTSQ